MFFNKTFTDELSSIKSAFQSTHDIYRANEY